MNLKKLRENAGYTQKYVADNLNVTKDYISLLENDKRKPSLKLLNGLAKLYKVKPVNIFLIVNRTICSECDSNTILPDPNQ